MKALAQDTDFRALAELLLGEGKEFRFRASGQSMSPFIRDGDLVTIVPSGDLFGVGDVVLARTTGGRLLLHRIIRKERDAVILRGDAHSSHDGIIPNQDVLGKVAGVSGAGYTFHLRVPFKYVIANWLPFMRTVSCIFPLSVLKKAIRQTLRRKPNRSPE